MNPVSSWSHSRVIVFEGCKHRTWLAQVQKIPEPERPLPPGKVEHANDRGTRIHTNCELAIKGEGPLGPEASKHFSPEFAALKSLYAQGRVSLEGEWGMNRAWEPTGWRGEWVQCAGDEIDRKHFKLPEFGKAGDMNFYKFKGKDYAFEWVPAWLRLKLDALVHVSEYEAIAIDFKSGKKFGNEMKHADQLHLYQLVTFLRYPKLEQVHTELWYLDADELTSSTFTRSQGLRFMRSWDKRGNNLTTCQDFPPNPSIHTCKYCPYGLPERGFVNGTGHCAAGRK
jgi:hypothetical protein